MAISGEAFYCLEALGVGEGGVQARREKHKIKNRGRGVQHGDAVTALGVGYADQNKHE